MNESRLVEYERAANAPRALDARLALEGAGRAWTGAVGERGSRICDRQVEALVLVRRAGDSTVVRSI